MIDYLKPLVDSFEKHADPVKATQMAAYMKNKFDYYGIPAPLRKELTKEFNTEDGPPEFGRIDRIARDLFKQPHRELHYATIELIGQKKTSWFVKTLHLFEELALTKSWWDSVDSLNLNCMKYYFLKFPERASEATDRWIDSGNIWLQRLSVIYQLRYNEKTDTRLLERNIRRLKDSDEFFVQKGIGWILRDYGKTHPEWVKRFVSRVPLKPLSKREALKHLVD